MNIHDLPDHIKKLNPHLFVGGVERAFGQQDLTRALVAKRPKRQKGPLRVVVGLVRYGRSNLDSDSLAVSFKPLQDAIAATLGIDDGDERISFRYGQIETTGQPGTMVTIEMV